MKLISSHDSNHTHKDWDESNRISDTYCNDNKRSGLGFAYIKKLRHQCFPEYDDIFSNLGVQGKHGEILEELTGEEEGLMEYYFSLYFV